MAPPAERHIGLGKGLGALIPQTSPAGAAPLEIPISHIRGNPYQPRQRVEQHFSFSQTAQHLEQLCDQLLQNRSESAVGSERVTLAEVA